MAYSIFLCEMHCMNNHCPGRKQLYESLALIEFALNMEIFNGI